MAQGWRCHLGESSRALLLQSRLMLLGASGHLRHLPRDSMRMPAMTLKWNGKALLRDVLRAAVPAMDDTTRAVVQNAQGKVRRRTGNLADSIDKEDAVLEGDEVIGAVGVSDKHGVIYAVIEEVRKPYIRPALDAEGPQLWKRIRDNLK